MFYLKRNGQKSNGNMPIMGRIACDTTLAVEPLLKAIDKLNNVGRGYNQVVKHLKATFSEKMALAFLYKLEKVTIELVATNRKIEELTREFEEKYLNKQ